MSQTMKGIYYRHFKIDHNEYANLIIDASSYKQEFKEYYGNSVLVFLDSLSMDDRRLLWLEYKKSVGPIEWSLVIESCQECKSYSTCPVDKAIIEFEQQQKIYELEKLDELPPLKSLHSHKWLIQNDLGTMTGHN
ncbi:hypothetical protein [Colwellia piezophila]|uniref:hypothetical protein n=1 Tax=Colwellia piezophila TaxID=211668 RepID=UPI00039F8E90|nr:hypothetical protein [Colwellia piezophila]